MVVGEKPNNKPYKEGSYYTGKEHSWDEAFGYWGAPAHSLTLSAEENYNVAKMKDLSSADYNGDGVVDLYSEMLYAHAYYASSYDKGRNNSFNIQFQLFDIFKREQIVGYRLPANESTLRRSAHRIADMVFEELTGIRGVFDTKVAYVRSNVSRDRSSYALVVSDSDGENEQIILE